VKKTSLSNFQKLLRIFIATMSCSSEVYCASHCCRKRQVQSSEAWGGLCLWTLVLQSLLWLLTFERPRRPKGFKSFTLDDETGCGAHGLPVQRQSCMYHSVRKKRSIPTFVAEDPNALGAPLRTRPITIYNSVL
jgi:hypothetical protein